MFLKSVALNSNGWHVKLQSFVRGRSYRPTNFCPFFWSTIACIGLAPIVAAFKALAFVILFAFDIAAAVAFGTADLVQRKAQPLHDKISLHRASKLTDYEVYKLWRNGNEKAGWLLNAWRKLHVGWEDSWDAFCDQWLPVYNAERDEMREAELALSTKRYSARLKRERAYEKIGLGVTCGGILAIVSTIIFGVVETILHNQGLQLLEGTGIGLTVVATIVGTVRFFVSNFMLNKFQFIKAAVVMFKGKHCPGIEWQ